MTGLQTHFASSQSRRRSRLAFVLFIASTIGSTLGSIAAHADLASEVRAALEPPPNENFSNCETSPKQLQEGVNILLSCFKDFSPNGVAGPETRALLSFQRSTTIYTLWNGRALTGSWLKDSPSVIEESRYRVIKGGSFYQPYRPAMTYWSKRSTLPSDSPPHERVETLYVAKADLDLKVWRGAVTMRNLRTVGSRQNETLTTAGYGEIGRGINKDDLAGDQNREKLVTLLESHTLWSSRQDTEAVRKLSGLFAFAYVSRPYNDPGSVHYYGYYAGGKEISKPQLGTHAGLMLHHSRTASAMKFSAMLRQGFYPLRGSQDLAREITTERTASAEGGAKTTGNLREEVTTTTYSMGKAVSRDEKPQVDTVFNVDDCKPDKFRTFLGDLKEGAKEVNSELAAGFKDISMALPKGLIEYIPLCEK